MLLVEEFWLEHSSYTSILSSVNPESNRTHNSTLKSPPHPKIHMDDSTYHFSTPKSLFEQLACMWGQHCILAHTWTRTEHIRTWLDLNDLAISPSSLKSSLLLDQGHLHMNTNKNNNSSLILKMHNHELYLLCWKL